MSIHFVQAYWVGLIGGAVGVIGGLVILGALARKSRLAVWDSRATLPLLLGVGFAHLFLIPVVEQQRQILFGLYGAALIGVTLFALAGLGIWRLGAVVFPLGSIAAYIYFALLVHEADYIGLLIKLAELAAIASAVASVFQSRTARASLKPSAH